MVGAVGEMASVKRLKMWRTGEDGLCCSSSAIQTRLGPSSLLEEQRGVPIVFVVLLCCRLPPKLEEMAKVYRYGIFILKIISKYKPVYSQSTNPCKAILLEYVPTF